MARQCDEVLDDIAAYVDGQLAPEESADVEAHLARCRSCQDEVQGQTSVKRQLKAIQRRENRIHPPARIWAEASRAWDSQDNRHLRRYQVRFALVAACLLLMLFGAVWARLSSARVFPVDVAMLDFRGVRNEGVHPALMTSDPDQSARWLRERLSCDLPPLDLKLSSAQLIGTDVVPMIGKNVGRLLYRTPHGLIGIYVSPGQGEFGDLKQTTVDGETFQKKIRGRDLCFYGWQAGGVGYGVIMPQGMTKNDLLIEAADDSHQPTH